MEGTIAPRRFIPSHTHSREDECSYILSGELMFQVGDETLTAGSGCYVIKPRDVNPDMAEQQRHTAQATRHAQYRLTFHWDRTRQLATRYDLQS